VAYFAPKGRPICSERVAFLLRDTQLGGRPRWTLGPFPREKDLNKIFQEQLEKEKLALKLHQQIVVLTTDSSLRSQFIEMSKEEELHIKTVQKILDKLA
jgi:bacterioferritin (cytochrome b1)